MFIKVTNQVEVAYFLIDFCTIGLLFVANGVASCWLLERMEV